MGETRNGIVVYIKGDVTYSVKKRNRQTEVIIWYLRSFWHWYTRIRDYLEAIHHDTDRTYSTGYLQTITTIVERKCDSDIVGSVIPKGIYFNNV